MTSDQNEDRGYGFMATSGLLLKYHKCGEELPLLHPHIMVERYDEEGNLICEDCYNAL